MIDEGSLHLVACVFFFFLSNSDFFRYLSTTCIATLSNDSLEVQHIVLGKYNLVVSGIAETLSWFPASTSPHARSLARTSPEAVPFPVLRYPTRVISALTGVQLSCNSFLQHRTSAILLQCYSIITIARKQFDRFSRALPVNGAHKMYVVMLA
jgi:hypothetical protein